jgi:hypothetical protein
MSTIREQFQGAWDTAATGNAWAEQGWIPLADQTQNNTDQPGGRVANVIPAPPRLRTRRATTSIVCALPTYEDLLQ